MISTLAIIQARSGSTRFPGKLMQLLENNTVLESVIDRLKQCKRIDQIVVATTENQADDAIKEIVRSKNIVCVRGAEEDVLQRFVDTSNRFESKSIVRICADNPLIDPTYLDLLIDDYHSADLLESNTYDYMSYNVQVIPCMLSPIGFFGEILSRECLLKAHQLIKDVKLREHVTLGIYQNPDEYKIHFVPAPEEFHDPRFRFTYDTAEDLEILRQAVALVGNEWQTAPAEAFVQAALTNPKLLRNMELQNRRFRK